MSVYVYIGTVWLVPASKYRVVGGAGGGGEIQILGPVEGRLWGTVPAIHVPVVPI